VIDQLHQNCLPFPRIETSIDEILSLPGAALQRPLVRREKLLPAGLTTGDDCGLQREAEVGASRNPQIRCFRIFLLQVRVYTVILDL